MVGGPNFLVKMVMPEQPQVIASQEEKRKGEIIAFVVNVSAEDKKESKVKKQKECLIDLERFSTLERAVRALRCVLRAIRSWTSNVWDCNGLEVNKETDLRLVVYSGELSSIS